MAPLFGLHPYHLCLQLQIRNEKTALKAIRGKQIDCSMQVEGPTALGLFHPLLINDVIMEKINAATLSKGKFGVCMVQHIYAATVR